jgi:hypothetical protein
MPIRKLGYSSKNLDIITQRTLNLMIRIFLKKSKNNGERGLDEMGISIVFNKVSFNLFIEGQGER